MDSASVALSTSGYDGAGTITISLIEYDNSRYILCYLPCVGERVM
jgi:hypothetical protein